MFYLQLSFISIRVKFIESESALVDATGQEMRGGKLVFNGNSFTLVVKNSRDGWWLNLNIQKTKNMASGLITLWEIDGETVETVSDFIFLGSKITADGDCSHEIKRHLLPGRKVMTNLDSIFKSRDIAD